METRYNLAYINPVLFGGDNGRVLGYDNQLGSHHRHFRGETQAFDFISFEDVEERFEREWIELVAPRQNES